MAACSDAKRARPAALEATVTTVTIPGLGKPNGMFVVGDGTRLFSSGTESYSSRPREGLPQLLGTKAKGRRTIKAFRLVSTLLLA